MKMRFLLIVGAFILGGESVLYRDAAIKALRQWEYTGPAILRAEALWADASGKSRAKLEAELAEKADVIVKLRSAWSEANGRVSVGERLVAERDREIARLKAEIEVCNQAGIQQATELEHAKQLLEASEAMVRETNWRFSQLTQRIRELGHDGAVSVLARE